MNTDSRPPWFYSLLFLAAAGAIGLAGNRMAGFADRIAELTGRGEAVTGTRFLGLTTALPGIAASVAAALDGRPTLAALIVIPATSTPNRRRSAQRTLRFNALRRVRGADRASLAGTTIKATLAICNAMGGIAIHASRLAVADLFHPGAWRGARLWPR